MRITIFINIINLKKKQVANFLENLIRSRSNFLAGSSYDKEVFFLKTRLAFTYSKQMFDHTVPHPPYLKERIYFNYLNIFGLLV